MKQVQNSASENSTDENTLEPFCDTGEFYEEILLGFSEYHLQVTKHLSLESVSDLDRLQKTSV